MGISPRQSKKDKVLEKVEKDLDKDGERGDFDDDFDSEEMDDKAMSLSKKTSIMPGSMGLTLTRKGTLKTKNKPELLKKISKSNSQEHLGVQQQKEESSLWQTLRGISKAAQAYNPDQHAKVILQQKQQREEENKLKEEKKNADQWEPDRTYSVNELLHMMTIKKKIYHGKVL